ncbi:MAG: thiol oxidoreductase [Arcobacter sp.]|nr:MAG: thiol oxidoreductase [Arcobacter sp.]
MRVNAHILSLVTFFVTGLFAFDPNYYTYPSKNAFTTPYSNLNNAEIDTAMLGKSFFKVPWILAPGATTARDGLGPLFNANTCVSCHPNNALGSVYNKKNISRAMVVRLSIPNSKKDLSYLQRGFTPEPTYGAQIAINGTHDVPFEAKLAISYENTYVTYKNGQTVVLKKPTYTLKNLNYGPLHKDTIISVRKAPALVGLGLLSLLSDEEILKNQDINDENNDGISGVANIVYSIKEQKFTLGRYTYKASAPSVVHQSAAAFINDMGLTSSYFPNDNCSSVQTKCNNAPKGRHKLDVPDLRLNAVAFYLKHLKVPFVKNKNIEGEKLFKSIGCISCHVSELKTKNNLIIKPFSDFLLHDMGEGLSDGRSEYKAGPQEWRTAPLWGINSYEKAIKKKVDYLHDGRASTIEEAILWHDGEAKNSKEAFKSLNEKNRQYLLKYIKEL